MTRFSDQLFDDLMREHGPALAHATPPAHPPRRVTMRRTLLAGGGTLAAAAIAGTLVATSGTPAYAVTKNPDGTITLAVYQKSGIAGANTRLRQLGDKQVVVVPVERGCTSKVTPPAVSGKGHLITTGISRSPDGTITVNAHGIPAGDILGIGVATSGNTSYSIGTLASPPAPGCVAPPPLPPGSGGSGTIGGPGGERR